MLTKQLCVLVLIRNKGEIGNFLTERSKVGLLLWILFVICISCLPLSYCLVCSLQPCGHMLVKG